MANKRPAAGKEFDPPPLPLKQPHLEGHIVFPPGTGVIPLTTPISHALSPVARGAESPGYISIPAIYPTTPRMEFGQHPTPTITVPSGIIPLATPTHGGHSTVGGVHFQALASAAGPIIRPLISQAPDGTISASPLVPSAPPPPYSAAEVMGTSSEEFSCSSPSQFLHSPTSVPIAPTRDGDESEHSPSKVTTENVKKLRQKELNAKKSQMLDLKTRYEKLLLEKFFLEAGGNMMDYFAWRKKPNILRDQYMKQHDLDSDIVGYGEDLLSPRDHVAGALMEQETPLDFDSVSARPSTHHLRVLTKELQVPKSSPAAVTTPTSLMVTPASSVTSPVPSLAFSSPRHRSHSTLSVTEVSHEDIVMRARQEAEVMKAIAELRKEGLWSSTRLPKVQEPQRIKTHWDYLLEEMQWLATDFANERRWKINAAKKLSRTVSRHHQEKEIQLQRAQKDELTKLRKIASTMAKDVKHFWDSIQKIVEHKQQALLDEKRKRAMDMHLNFIVDQTQKYSSWLMQGLTTPDTNSQSDPSLVSTITPKEADSDDLFTPVQVDESDDEETIEKEESMALQEGELDHKDELLQLQRDSEMPLDELLASLPPGMIEEPGSVDGGRKEETPTESTTSSTSTSKVEQRRSKRKRTRDDIESSVGVSSKVEKRAPSDEEYRVSEGEGAEEDETTLLEQEEHEQGTDYTDEISNLQQEGDMPIEELLKRYRLQRESATPDTDVEGSVREGEDGDSDMECGDSGDDGDQSASEEEEEEEGAEQGERKEEVPLSAGDAGLEFLVQSASKQTEVSEADREKGLKDVAAVAQGLQPKGITLSTTEVKTKVPLLLKHTLREYQHIGLDWLVTMHERHLNGILADEMGLGKTIQTIALLAHLACDKGNWGPHLIIVPTSVMLNWEYEFKKWCPGFKIITYFGSYKERKQKRVGWSKYNAFHICVTSYNIAVQDHRVFKQKKWKYLVLDEAQNIKNFKSQRWQTLLTFNSQHRLLLTGTPLQNNLMELWSLMHFLMPAVFSSHSDFKEWFSNPLTGMVEGSQEYNESIIHRLHQVLRPFLLRRLKMEVEKQLPNKYEHIVVCRLSKRQRYLYEDYMSRAKTKETLSTGNYLSVINVLMQLRKVCNHPDLFEPRPVVSPFRMAGLLYTTASLVLTPLHYDPFKHVSLDYLNLALSDYEVSMEAFVSYRAHQLQAVRSLMMESCNDLTSCGMTDTGDCRMETQECYQDLSTSLISSRRTQWTISCHEHLHEVNMMHCRRRPVYGTDLVRAIQMVTSSDKSPKHPSTTPSHWLWCGYSACRLEMVLPERQSVLMNCLWLKDMITSYTTRTTNMADIIKRFVITTPKVSSPPVSMHVPHPHPSDVHRARHAHAVFADDLASRPNLFHDIATRNCLQFPETRLIQYDCGKLQTLDVLLRRLKNGSHRVLMFTQMARMLDVLEIFLTYHGHTYLRLDGATPIHKRQMLMTRFNKDTRVFCFILSTRSGGLGVNLTGADTVIFYDSDWNPTMDAQAQDRCHRIGQTKDVHIYRLVCDSTVEENILKKANQKRMLGDIAIEGGAFTTDFFKKKTIQEIFDVQEKEEPISEGVVISEGVATSDSMIPNEDSSTSESVSAPDPSMTQKQLEELLLQAEEENDVEAARKAREEQVAELAEFDEQFLDSQQQGTDKYDAQYSRVLEGFASLESQLSGVELYAMKFLEAENAEVAKQQLLNAEASIEQAKKDWELSHLQQLREREERMAREEEEEEEAMSLTYDRPELVNKIMMDEETGEEMPIWLPPTPPSDDSIEYYNDVTLSMSYDMSNTMTPDVLGSVAMYSDDDYDVFGLYKPHTVESTIEPIKKSHKSAIKIKRENIAIPQSLFWRRYTPDLLTSRIRKISPQTKKVKVKTDQFTPLFEAQEGPEWLVSEDWILIKGLTAALEFPLSLAATVPAQMPNWSILADLVCSLSKNKRSPLQSKDHLVGVIIPREEQIHSRADDFEIRKQKGREPGLKKHKSHREQRTRNLMLKDRGKEMTKQFTQCFNWITIAAGKRVVQSKQRSEVASLRSSMHNELLQKEYEINLDSVRSPMQLAQLRAERIQSEIPRGTQVPQLHSHTLTQSAYSSQLSRQYNSQVLSKTASTAVHLPASVSQLAQRLQASISSGANSQTTSSTTVQAADTPASLPSKAPQTQSSINTSTNSPATSQITIITTSSAPSTTTAPNAAAVAAAVAKTYHGVDITKGILLGSRLTPQQLLLLKQTALQQQQIQKQQQQQQAASTTASTPSQIQQRQATQIRTPPMTTHLQTSSAAQSQTPKIQLPSGIEQLRSSITLPASQRALVRGSGSGSGGLPTRSMQTEEVVALLKQQQAIRMATARLVNQSQTSSATIAQTIGLTDAIAAAAAIAKQNPKPSIVTPAESMKSSERTEASQLKVELVEHPQAAPAKQPPPEKK